jgi:hypothetical protein
MDKSSRINYARASQFCHTLARPKVALPFATVATSFALAYYFSPQARHYIQTQMPLLRKIGIVSGSGLLVITVAGYALKYMSKQKPIIKESEKPSTRSDIKEKELEDVLNDIRVKGGIDHLIPAVKQNFEMLRKEPNYKELHKIFNEWQTVLIMTRINSCSYPFFENFDLTDDQIQKFAQAVKTNNTLLPQSLRPTIDLTNNPQITDASAASIAELIEYSTSSASSRLGSLVMHKTKFTWDGIIVLLERPAVRIRLESISLFGLGTLSAEKRIKMVQLLPQSKVRRLDIEEVTDQEHLELIVGLIQNRKPITISISKQSSLLENAKSRINEALASAKRNDIKIIVDENEKFFTHCKMRPDDEDDVDL